MSGQRFPRFEGFIWLEPIVEKLHVKHRVEVEEVAEVFERRPLFRFVEKGHRSGENVYSALGQTEAGRYLTVFFIRKKDHRALVVSARDMTPAERKHYDPK